jgi:hypothetical protein
MTLSVKRNPDDGWGRGSMRTNNYRVRYASNASLLSRPIVKLIRMLPLGDDDFEITFETGEFIDR